MVDESGAGIRRLGHPPSRTPGHWCAHRIRPLFHRNWMAVEAVVTKCFAARPEGGGEDGTSILWGYFVEFNYTVDGSMYSGVTLSRDEFEPGDSFVLYCNPNRPEQNNTFDSETSWVPAVGWAMNILMAVIFIGCFVWYKVLGHS